MSFKFQYFILMSFKFLLFILISFKFMLFILMSFKIDTVICLRMGKIYTAKTPSGDFKVTTSENSLLSQQAITSKGISAPYTNLQLNPYPNTQLDLFCSDNLSFSMHSSQYVTNQFNVQIPVCGLLTNLRKMLAAKFFSSSHDEDHETPWLQNPTMYKHRSFFKKKMELDCKIFVIAIDCKIFYLRLLKCCLNICHCNRL